MTTRVTVVGGGIAGLAAAWEAVQRGAEVTVLEASDRLGGKIETAPIDGAPVEAGPDAFLARVPAAVQLCEELGLSSSLVSPAVGRALVWSNGRLRPLPEAMLLGVPTGVVGVVRSGLLSPLGMARASLDLVLPATPADGDESVASLVGRRLGREVVERLVEPLVGGINAGVADELSADAVVPQIVAAARAHRSIVVGARRQRAAAAGGPVFLTPRDGLSALVGRLVERLQAAGAAVHTGAAVDSLDDVDGAVVLAVPAGQVAGLLRRRAPDAADELAAIRYASVALTTFTYPVDAVPRREASGFLVPRRSGRLITAASFATTKWPHWSLPGQVVLRVSAGRAGDERALRLDDDTLVARLHEELVELAGVGGGPVTARVHRWVDGFPQYAVGHLDRVARIERALPAGVALAGAAYRGLGIPACIQQGRAAAAHLVPST
ncbi:MAG: protoporphyrinogen oxidase [Actinobacteria bacterium]|nr:protoporphyrinogen oxidase [Actinomycetota bacterium]